MAVMTTGSALRMERAMNLFKRGGSPYWWASHYAGGARHRCSLKTTNNRQARRLAERWVVKLEAGLRSRANRFHIENGGIPLNLTILFPCLHFIR